MIDEKKLIEELEKQIVTITTPDDPEIRTKYWNAGISYALNCIEKQPKVGEWIPCNDKLPEEGKNVLCTEEGTQSIYVGWMTNVEELGSCWFDDAGFSMQVVAWMPLPEPYRGDEE